MIIQYAVGARWRFSGPQCHNVSDFQNRGVLMSQKRSLSRRGFAAVLGATGVAAAQQQPPAQQPAAPPNPNTSLQPQQRRQGTLEEVPPFKEPIQFARKD